MIGVVFFFFRSINNSHLPHYRYYLPNFFVKVCFAVAFAVTYIVYYKGGDTIAYYSGAVTLDNLLIKSPALYLDQILSTPTYNNWFHFDHNTGYPPGWIYREPEGYFVCKIMSVLGLISFKSYLAMTLIVTLFTTGATWKLYEFVRSLNIVNDRYLAYAILFIPSVNFWCGGISKDSLIMISLIYVVIGIFNFILDNHKPSISSTLAMIVGMFVIYHIRSFILISVLVPALIAFSSKAIRYFGGSDTTVIIIRSLVLITGVVIMGSTILNTSESDFVESNSSIKEASIIQKDFVNNKAYGTKRYDLGNVEFSPIGLIQLAPIAILTGLYRPLIWEAGSPTLIMNGLESILFLFFTIRFLFSGRLREKMRLIRLNELLLFCFIFAVIIAFMTGLTSGLYGVLVRLRAPALPFFFLLLTLDFNTGRKLDTKSQSSL